MKVAARVGCGHGANVNNERVGRCGERMLRGPSSCPVLVLKRVCGASWSSSLMVHEITSGVSSWVSLAALV